MKYYLVCSDGYFLAKDHESLTKNKHQRAEFTHYKFAKWHAKNTSVFGQLKIKKVKI